MVRGVGHAFFHSKLQDDKDSNKTTTKVSADARRSFGQTIQGRNPRIRKATTTGTQ